MSGTEEAIKCYHTLADHTRLAALALVIIVATSAAAVFLNRPVISQQMLVRESYPIDFCERLVAREGSALKSTFLKHQDILDYPYDQIARRFVSARTPGEQSQALARFINTQSPAKEEYVLLIASLPGVRASLHEYLQARIAAMQEFAIPLVGMQVDRSHLLTALLLSFGAIYCYMLAHRCYARSIRRDGASREMVIHDPSLLTVTVADLQVLARHRRLVIIAGQYVFLLGLPIVMFAIAVTYVDTIQATSWVQDASVLIAAGIMAVMVVCSLWVWCDVDEFHAQWAELKPKKPNPN